MAMTGDGSAQCAFALLGLWGRAAHCAAELGIMRKGAESPAQSLPERYKKQQ
jgi:hypothetical protein